MVQSGRRIEQELKYRLAILDRGVIDYLGQRHDEQIFNIITWKRRSPVVVKPFGGLSPTMID